MNVSQYRESMTRLPKKVRKHCVDYLPKYDIYVYVIKVDVSVASVSPQIKTSLTCMVTTCDAGDACPYSLWRHHTCDYLSATFGD